MKQINKGKEPESLTTHRQQEHADYNNYQEKDDLREALCIEQRGICCYCMGAIKPDSVSMKIEHWQCQENFPGMQLIFANLLGACKGNEGEKKDNTHCDTFKGNKDFSRYPPSQVYRIEDLIVYSNDGTIKSNNQQLDRELNEVLNLNVQRLKNNRKAALDGFKDGLTLQGKLSRPLIQRWLNDWKGLNHNDNLKPYCMVVIYWLQKRLNRA